MTDTPHYGNWPDPERPGVPLNPDQDRLHYITDGVALVADKIAAAIRDLPIPAQKDAAP
jgi:hypothetical protein